MKLHLLGKLLRHFRPRAETAQPEISSDIATHKEFIRLYRQCSEFTMTSPERMYALYRAVQHISRQQVPGDIVECGVWRGGSSMLAALTLQELSDTNRTIYLYDTFAGMPPPDNADGSRAELKWQKKVQRGTADQWCYASLDEVRSNMQSTGYPFSKLVFTEGKVEDTIPKIIPQRIAILRLDTDWYASTKHELKHLFPRLASGGVLIIDDYGTWEGARKAVDEYLAMEGTRDFLHRIDSTGALLIKH